MDLSLPVPTMLKTADFMWHRKHVDWSSEKTAVERRTHQWMTRTSWSSLPFMVYTTRLIGAFILAKLAEAIRRASTTA